MELSQHIILLGSGHLATQVARKLREKNCAVVHISPGHFDEVAKNGTEGSILDAFRRALREAGIDFAKAVYIVDEEDRYNLEFALAAIPLNATVPIFVSLFNEEVAPHFQAAHRNLHVCNPALIAASVFVESLRCPKRESRQYNLPPARLIDKSRFSEIRSDVWLIGLILGFLFLLLCSTVFFHRAEDLSWLDAFYFTTRVMTTSDFGDMSLRHSSPAAKLFGIFVMVAALALVSITFSFTIDRLLRRRSEIALGRRRYRLRNHVIVCGLGRLGYGIVEELIRRHEQVLVIDQRQENRFLEAVRSRGARVFIGDASLPNNLRDAGVENAAGLISTIDDDMKNLEIGLNARSQHPNLRLILRIFHKEIAEELREQLDIQFALSSSTIAADQFAASLEPAQ